MAEGAPMICTNGHTSEWDDYCSVCGESMGQGSGGAVESVAVSSTPQSAESEASESTGEATISPAATTCPNCSEATGADDIFCENCGYDFLSGTVPDEPGAGTGPVAGTGPAEPAWSAVVSVDLDFFERMQFAGVEPPATAPEPVHVELPPTDILVGRHSESRGTFPEIDLGSIFEAVGATDPAVSSNHCRLHRGANGWTVTDLGSTNGTYVADETDPLAAGTPMSLLPGTPIFVGAWTRIDLEEVSQS